MQEKNTTKSKDKSKDKKKEIRKVSQTKMDSTKLTQNKEIPTAVTTDFDADFDFVFLSKTHMTIGRVFVY